MRASPPYNTWNVLTAISAVATTPTQPRPRIHHANSASAAQEKSNDGERRRKSLADRGVHPLLNDGAQFPLEFVDLVPQPCRFLEPEVACGVGHLVLELLDEAAEIVGGYVGEVEHRRAPVGAPTSSAAAAPPAPVAGVPAVGPAHILSVVL